MAATVAVGNEGGSMKPLSKRARQLAPLVAALAQLIAALAQLAGLIRPSP
jgi:hypothetical protein